MQVGTGLPPGGNTCLRFVFAYARLVIITVRLAAICVSTGFHGLPAAQLDYGRRFT